MAGYDNPLTISYSLGLLDFAAGATANAIQRPAGKEHARIEELHVSVTEVFNGVTTNAFLQVGTASDANKFADMDMGAAAATDGYGTNDDPDAILAAGAFIDLDRDGDSGASLDQLEITTVPNTGGTPTGIGEVTVVISWF